MIGSVIFQASKTCQIGACAQNIDILWYILCNKTHFVHRKKQIDDIVMQLVDEQSEDSDDNASAESPSNSGEKSPKEVLCIHNK